jgi:arabinose-5-phosphate isomerase
MDHIKHAQDVIRIECEAIAALGNKLDDHFTRAVEAILKCKGRVIVTGMGKSGLVGRKIAATFCSTGISSFFLHPAEALHGDLGLMQSDDVLIVISKSGQLQDTGEVIATARRMEILVIALCGNTESDLFRRADIGLDCSVEKEACPNNLVPTSSSTAAMVMGDALAVALLRARHFSAEDFAALHPGGFIGFRLLKRVGEVHHTGDDIPLIKPQISLSEMMVQMTGKRMGCVVMVDENGRPSGIFTDGDLRRLWERTRDRDLIKLTAGDVVVRSFKSINQDALLDSALSLMERYAITQLPTVDDDGRLTGIVHLHDILKSKLV